MADDESESTTAKVIGMVTALGTAWVARKVLAAVWTKATGHAPPDPATKDPDIKLSEALLAAAVTGAVAYLSRAVATRGTARISGRVRAARPPLPKR
ncbi:DUF4235 domain-containing protein [Cellulomonas marina]|uniref:DUF4235 domain-containing protein n=1 Tax=Cellulomonas marina TaxID=988821 RepID=A0A1I0YCJ9_9CELL|nr:DUF4235 domain-containing protein [Cellulomonas marina]GIG29632.1 hypothetical protein Cma02nite_22320 [Cellulomonas marina]SFB10527.1 Protein of unknown function [Cellulomonas marina]